MRLARTIWLFSRRDRPGQGMVEFALVAPLFLLFVFGIIQVALLYFVNSALAQAATDGSHVVSAQSSSGPLDLNGDPDQTKFLESWQGDGPALSYIQAAMASQNLNNIQQIDIFPADVNGKAVQVTINASQDLPIASTQTLMLVNQYRLYPPPGGPICPVGIFYLWNPLPSPFSAWDQGGSPSTQGCVMPWNSRQYSYKTNQNGRDDQRCSEPMAYVKITYNYRPLLYPLIPAVTLVAHDETPLEPRQFTQNITGQQDITCSQFPLFGG